MKIGFSLSHSNVNVNFQERITCVENFQVNKWLSRAEDIKQFLEVHKLSTLDTSAEEEAENKSLTRKMNISLFFKTFFI